MYVQLTKSTSTSTSLHGIKQQQNMPVVIVILSPPPQKKKKKKNQKSNYKYTMHGYNFQH